MAYHPIPCRAEALALGPVLVQFKLAHPCRRAARTACSLSYVREQGASKLRTRGEEDVLWRGAESDANMHDDTRTEQTRSPG